MNYILYGMNRVSKDFIYIFDDIIEIIAVCEDTIIGDLYCGKKTLSTMAAIDLCESNTKIIICDFQKQSKVERLDNYGLKYNDDYLFEEDLFYLIDEVNYNPNGKRNIVWGTGSRAYKFFEWNNSYEIDFCIDSYNNRNTFFGKKVVKPNQIRNWEDYFIIISVSDDSDIKLFLLEKGLVENRDFCNMQDIISIPSELLKQTIFDLSHYDFECNTFNDHIELHLGGRIDCCCSAFTNLSIGNVNTFSVNDIWNGIKHKIAVLSIMNRTYTFCKKDMCPFFYGKEPNDSYELDRKYKKISSAPSTVLVAFDNGCNLFCESCRNNIYLSDNEKKIQMDTYADIVIKDILPRANFLIMAGNGEVLLNHSYRKIYESEQADELEYIRILSNGLLFTPYMWSRFKSGKKGRIMLTVSIDAATKGTYEIIRRGGNFDILKKNMEFASVLRKNDELKYFRINFVVQRKNYMEMPLFVKWGKDLGCDEVFFTKILNWGTYSDEEFEDVSMFEEDMVTPKNELKKVIDMEIMKDPIVNLGTINYSQEVISFNYIDNYYKWEMQRSYLK